MVKKTNVLFCFLLIFAKLGAQKPEEVLKDRFAAQPIEKIYLHFDRDNYIAGETAWFKAYLYSDYLPDTISTVLYVELLDQASIVISRKVLPVLLSNSNGHIDLPDSLNSGFYSLRAYTPSMLNHDPDFIYKKSVFIYGRSNNTRDALAVSEPSIKLEFFPEGGSLINGFVNTVAFKATNEKGFPVSVSGSVRNEKDEEITTFSSYHDGMGMFELSPLANKQYYVFFNNTGSGKKYVLPESTDKGIAVTIIPHPQGSFFEVRQKKNESVFQAAFMIGQMQHHVVFKQELTVNKEEVQGVINTKHLNSGILQITFFNKDNQPLAERLCFVNNKEYIQPADLVADSLDFSSRAKNRFSLVMKDTIKGTFSVSVTDPDYNLLPLREENIFSGFLLTSDLKGYIHNPAYYFSTDNDSVKTAIDLVMMTNGWRRFKWIELAQKASIATNYPDQAYITLSGKVTLRDTRKPFAEKPLLLMLITADSTRRIQMTNTDKQGFFKIDSMLFFGKSRLLFSDIRGKKNQFIDVNLSNDSISRIFPISFAKRQPLFISDSLLAVKRLKMGLDYDAILKVSGLMLQGITLKTKKKSAIQELEEKYASGMFSGGDNKVLDLVNNKDTEHYLNIFDYLQSRVPGLNIITDGPDYSIYYRQIASLSSMGMIPMTLYLDEIETDAGVIATIPAAQIAMVKVFSNFVGSSGGGSGGALAIYTKKDADMADAIQQKADVAYYNGFSVIKEFYAPNYNVDKSIKDKADQRITLDWRPDIFVNNINPKIPFSFYNNDRTKQFKVVIEGMTTSGKLLMIEKTFSAKAF